VVGPGDWAVPQVNPEANTEKFNSYLATALRSRDSVPVELLLLLLAFIRPHLGDLVLPQKLPPGAVSPPLQGRAYKCFSLLLVRR